LHFIIILQRIGSLFGPFFSFFNQISRDLGKKKPKSNKKVKKLFEKEHNDPRCMVAWYVDELF
jgi:hypothetical protein